MLAASTASSDNGAVYSCPVNGVLDVSLADNLPGKLLSFYTFSLATPAVYASNTTLGGGNVAIDPTTFTLSAAGVLYFKPQQSTALKEGMVVALSYAINRIATLRPQGPSSTVRSVAYSPDGTQLASGSLDNTVKLWDARNGTLIATLKNHTAAVNSVAYSPDGTQDRKSVV